MSTAARHAAVMLNLFQHFLAKHLLSTLGDPESLPLHRLLVCLLAGKLVLLFPFIHYCWLKIEAEALCVGILSLSLSTPHYLPGLREDDLHKATPQSCASILLASCFYD